MIPSERHDSESNDPRGGSNGDFDWGDVRRGGVDDALRMRTNTPEPARSKAESIGGWLVAPLLLAATGAGMLLVVRGPDQWFAIAFGAVLALGLAWILVSSLFPARADRACPSCSRATLTRLDPKSLQGVRCRACGWCDESASAFLFAEEDGAELEDLVLRERKKFRRW